MTIKNSRRSERMPAKEQVSIRWENSVGQPRFALVNCLNISEDGISILFREPIPVRCYVSVSSEKLKLAGNAAVKYCIRQKTWFQIGLEFTGGLKFKKAPVFSFE
jgi:hypothetical protein